MGHQALLAMYGDDEEYDNMFSLVHVMSGELGLVMESAPKDLHRGTCRREKKIGDNLAGRSQLYM